MHAGNYHTTLHSAPVSSAAATSLGPVQGRAGGLASLPSACMSRIYQRMAAALARDMHCIHGTGFDGGGGEGGLRRRHGPGQGTGRLRAIAVARESAGGMRGGRVACGFPSGGGKGEGRRGCSFFCSCWVLLILWSQVFFPSGGPEQVQRGWRAGASYYCCCWGSLRCVFPASGDRVCVCDVGRALSAPVKPWSEQARGLGSAHGRVQGLRIGWVEGMSHRPRGGVGIATRWGPRWWPWS